VSNIAEARVDVDHFGRHCLWDHVSQRPPSWGQSSQTFGYLQHLKNGVILTKPML
jgi:hypothetical protein